MAEVKLSAVENTVHLLSEQEGQVLEGNFSYKEVILQVFQYKTLPKSNAFSHHDIKQQYGITPEMWTEMHVCLSCTI